MEDYKKRCTTDIDNEWRRLKPKIAKLKGDKCFYCGEAATEYHHIIPRHMGGDNRLENILPICTECHRKAHSKRSYRPHGNWGRPKKEMPDNFTEVIDLYLNNQILFTEALEKTGLKKNVFYRMLEQYREDTGDYRKHKNTGNKYGH